MTPARIPLLALLVVLSGCAALRQLARPDPEPAKPDDPWSLRCVWVEQRPPGPDAALGPLDHGHVWAVDPNGRRVAIRGTLEDGFLRVDELFAWTPERGDEPLGVPASASALQMFCDDTLATEFAGRGVTLDRIVAARAGEDVDVPMALAPGLDGVPRGVAKRVVVFGDSLSDPGNLKRRLKVFPNAPYYLGRFSNGPNWTQYLAERTSIPIYNHAVGGTVSAPHEDIPSTGILAAVEQGGQYLLTGSLDEYVGAYLARDLQDGQLQRTNDTVFMIWSGGNDYLSKEPLSGEIDTLLDSPHDAAGYVRVVEETTTAITDQVRRLYAAGGRRFVLMTLPDLGQIPGVLHNESYRPRGQRTQVARRAQLSRRLTALSRYHNRELEKKVAVLRRELVGASISVNHTQQALTGVLDGRLEAHDGKSVPFKYGFDLRSLRSTALHDRRGTIPMQDSCYEGGYLGTGDPANVCRQAADAFFWDQVHPTSYAHCWVAFFVERDLARAGLLDAEPDAVAQRSYCDRRQRATAPAGARRDPAEVSAP